MISTLRALANLIVQQVDLIESTCEEKGLSLPSVDEPFSPQAETARNDPQISRAVTLLSAAANEIALVARPPQATVLMKALGYLESAAVRAASDLHVPDILRPAGASGSHIKDIASKANVDPSKLSRILRFLATHGIFKEISPDVYANNRLSSVLEKGRDIDLLTAQPEKQYENAQSAFPALIGHLTDESAKASAYLYETLVDPKWANSGDANHCAISKAFNAELSLWDLLELQGNEGRLKRFGVAMEGSSRVDPIENLLGKFDWSVIPAGSTVVDVGGGIGTVSMALTKMQPQLNLVVQDRASVVADGPKRWSDSHGEVLASGRVVFQAHDFFQPQPVQSAAAYLLKSIIHDWSDPYATEILTRIREAAAPDSKLLVIDRILPYACRIAGEDVEALNALGIETEDVPEPLPPNLGAGNPTAYATDLNMLVLVNGQERTIGHFTELFSASRWKIVRVYQSGSVQFGRTHSLIEAVPV